ncbi:MAG: NAD(+) kinase, partial [Chlorobi bacterium]|nr:NAD(+) kinase [Chlorobiota bacterium]
MRIAVFGKRFGDSFNETCISLFRILEQNSVEVVIYRKF